MDILNKIRQGECDKETVQRLQRTSCNRIDAGGLEALKLYPKNADVRPRPADENADARPREGLMCDAGARGLAGGQGERAEA